MSRQSLSNHLACLRGCGLVVVEPEGRRARYELADTRVGTSLASLLDIAMTIGPCEVDDTGRCR